jgi:hypothetical protein
MFSGNLIASQDRAENIYRKRKYLQAFELCTPSSFPSKRPVLAHARGDVHQFIAVIEKN